MQCEGSEQTPETSESSQQLDFPFFLITTRELWCLFKRHCPLLSKSTIWNCYICCNERTVCTKCLSFTVMQFYVVLLSDWVEWAWFITSVHLRSSSSTVLKWDNVLYSLWQVARMTLLSYPQNVSITGVKQADHLAFSPSLGFQTIQGLLKHLFIQITYYNGHFGGMSTHEKSRSTLKNANMDTIITWFMNVLLLIVPQCNSQLEKCEITVNGGATATKTQNTEMNVINPWLFFFLDS